MYTDLGLQLAVAEVTPNGGLSPGGLGQKSAGFTAVTGLHLDPSGLTTAFRNFDDIGAGRNLLLDFTVTTAFTCATFNASLELQLVSLPIIASSLTDATTTGKRTHRAAVALTDTGDTATIVGHNLPLGTPVYLSAIGGGTTGVVTNRIYYVVPLSANTFGFADSLALAKAGTILALTTTGTGTVEFIPTIHASTGQMPLFFHAAMTPTNQGPLRANSRFQIPVRPLANLAPNRAGVQPGQTLEQSHGAGPTLGLLGANAQRYYYLRYLPSATITAGAINCDLVLSSNDSLTYSGSGFQVI